MRKQEIWREKLLKLPQLNLLINLLDNLNIQYQFGSNGLQFLEQLGKMFILSHTMNQISEEIMWDQEIECYHYSNMQIIDSSSVLILIQMLTMHFNKSLQSVRLRLLIKLLGFMLIMLIVEKQLVFIISIRLEQLNVKRNYQLFIEFLDI